MDITCGHCNTTLKLPEEKLPKNQAIRLTCPKCRNKIVVNPVPDRAVSAPSLHSSAKEVSSDGNSAGKDPFDFTETERETALVCEHDTAVKNKICSVLEGMNYHITQAVSQEDALKKVRFHPYDLVVVNESFEDASPEDNEILGYLNKLTMTTRRNIFVALLGKDLRTMDNMTAFARSVNVVINPKDLNQLGLILKKSLAQHMEFYRVFKSVLKGTVRG
ncbi:MAG: zinc-ribbon domain-containing protein [Deltaproteobacteria bacterium]|jgi:CheY-like chemotaxis protein/DNA-directed RNA polymerase subunit RPC12/RpoP|nr:zinc-ribbon domain-containing protein [Deltaproteobacteria bacterium]